MAFCSSCGAVLEGDSRFCAKCGHDQTAKASGAPAAAPAAPMGPPLNTPFMASGPVPMPMGPGPVQMPTPAPVQKSGMMWVAALVVAAGGYYYYTHYMRPPAPQTPTAQTQPGDPGQQPGANPGQQPANPGQQPGDPGQQPGNPGQQPGGYPQQQPTGNPGQQPGQQPGGYPGQQPGQQPGGNPGQQPGQQPGGQGGQGGANQALVQAQQFAWQGQPSNGQIQITKAEWRNGSNVTIQAAELECIQYGANNQPLSQLTKVLNGPVQPGQTINIQPFTLGAEAQGVTNMKCGIVAVQPAN